MKNCKNCGEESGDKFCPKCGHVMEIKRLEIRTIYHKVTHCKLYWENSILKTFKMLLLYPGTTVKDYISGMRKTYVKPFSYFIFLQTLYVILL